MLRPRLYTPKFSRFSLALTLVILSLIAAALAWPRGSTADASQNPVGRDTAPTLTSAPEPTPTIRYVVPDGLTSGTCDSWANACAFKYAVDTVAVSGNEVWVKTGTYKPTTTTTRTVYFNLKNGVAIYGGFAGGETARDQRDWAANPTTLSGDIGTAGDNSDNSYHVVYGYQVGGSTVLDGFAVTGGNANSGSTGCPGLCGGGVYLYNGSSTSGPNLAHLFISGNKAVNGGGAYLYQSGPAMQAITFANNTATGKASSGLGGWGGGLYAYWSSPSITGSSFDSNHSLSDQGQYVYGGGLYIDHSGGLTLTDSTLTNNAATVPGWSLQNDTPSSAGGGAYVYYCNPTISRLTVSQNTANIGGGIYDFNSSPSLTDVTFNANTAIDSGGGLLNFSQSSPTLNNVTFKNNAAGTWNIRQKYPPPSGGENSGGGGLYNGNQSNPTLSNVTFVGNHGGVGGAIINDDHSSPVFRHITIYQNTADGTDLTIEGGGDRSAGLGAAVYNVLASHPQFINSIIWGNTNANTTAADQIYSTTIDYNGSADNSSATITYADVQGGFSGDGNINADPLLGPLGTHGGATEVSALLPSSPAIDSGSDELASPATDQRGVARPQGPHRDMGSFESQGFTITKSGGDNQATVVNQMFPNALVVSVDSSHGEPVDGGKVTFTPPVSGASAALSSSSASIAGGQASVNAQANSVVGAYSVEGDASGANSVSFSLENLTTPHHSPTDITLSSSSVAENQPTGTTVGTLSTTDEDAGGTYTYSLVTGGGSDDNASFVIESNALKAAASFDCEAKSSYHIRVRTTDETNLTFDKQFTVTVTNVDEAPTISDIADQTFDEGQTITIPFTVGDPDTDLSTLSFEGSTDNFNLIGGFTFSGSGAQRTVTINPNTAINSQWYGRALIQIRVSEYDNTKNVWLSAVDQFQLTIRPGEELSLVVTTTSDTTAGDGKTTLREALKYSEFKEGDDTITFDIPKSDPGYDAATNTYTITLVNETAAFLQIMSNVQINGPADSRVRVRATGSRVFEVSEYNNVVAGISNLTITGGLPGTHINVSDGTPNVIGENGGGIENKGTLTLTDCTVSGNHAGDATYATPGYFEGGKGGGIYNSGTLTVVRNTISDNHAGSAGANASVGAAGGSGGGVYNEGAGTVMIIDSTISGNTAGGSPAIAIGFGGSGGGIANFGKSVTLVNSTVSGNSAGDGANEGGGGGSLYNFGSYYVAGTTHYDGTLSITSCTVTNNHAGAGATPGNGGGVFDGVNNGQPGIVNLRGSIIAANGVATGGLGPDLYGTINSQDYNLFGSVADATLGGETAHNIITPDPLLGPLSDNGGPTFTHTLLAGSPAIDKGKSFSLTTDQRGVSRTFDGHAVDNAAGGDGTDIGSYEVQDQKPVAQSQAVTAAEDTTVEITFAATDADRDPLNFTIIAGTGHGQLVTIGTPKCTATPGTCTMLATYTPAPDYSGPDSFSFKVNDGTVDSDEATVTIMVSAVNDPPTLSDIPDQTTTKNTPAGAIAYTIGDVDNSADSLTDSASSSNQTLVPNGSIVIGGVKPNRTLTITPAANQVGTTTITVQVSDGASVTSKSFTLRVTETPSLVVTTTSDEASDFDGVTSLREAITYANSHAGDDTITFNIPTGDPGYDAANNKYTIKLGGTQLDLNSNVQIKGPNSSSVVVNADMKSRVFGVAPGAVVGISRLTLTRGHAPNTATATVEMSGGAIFNRGTLTLEDCVLNNNYSGYANAANVDGGGGGGAYNAAGAQLTLTRTKVTGNIAGNGTGTNGSGGAGAGLYNAGTVRVTDSTLESNSCGAGLKAGGGGGAIFSAGGSVTVTGTTIRWNASGANASTREDTRMGAGGGIYNLAGTMLVANSTVNGNRIPGYTPGVGGEGGGIYNAGRLTLVASTVTGNEVGKATGSGGGIYAAEGGETNLRSSIVANNTVPAGAIGPDIFGAVVSQDYNLIEDTAGAIIGGVTAHNITGVDPNLDNLADNGGPTLTQALSINSPAVNAGDDTVMDAPLNLSTDQRGLNRKVGAHVDIGAFEIQQAINQTPAAQSQPVTLVEDPGAPVQIVLTATDADYDPLTFSVTADPAHGLLDRSGLSAPDCTTTPGICTVTVRYLPAADYNGPDLFKFRVSDGHADSAEAAVSITVTAVSDPPTANDDNVTVEENSGAVVVDVLANDTSSPDTGETLTVTSVTQAAHGTSGLEGGAVSYAPAPGYHGPDSFTYTVGDGNGGAASAKVNVTVREGEAHKPMVQFSSTAYTVLECDLHATITVRRSGDLSQPATVDYSTFDPSGLTNCSQVTGDASQRCDYAIGVGTLRFASGEAEKTIYIPIINDVYVGGEESFTITLSKPVGMEMGEIASAKVNIMDDDNGGAANPLVDDAFFVRQLYIDFLDREPEPAGLQGWLDVLHNSSGQCKVPTDCDRIAVALGFVRSPEFQTRGYFAFRLYTTVLGRNPSYNEFIPDMAHMSGFLNDLELEANKDAFVEEFMGRSEFKNLYDPTLGDPPSYVDKLLKTAGLPDHPSRGAWIAGLANNSLTPRQVLRQLVESSEVYTRFYNRAIVVMNYFAFLRRDPDALYLRWIEIFNETNDHRIITNGFINSQEYVIRFGP